MASIYDLVQHDGNTVDRITHEALCEVERRLGYPLTITQGSYSTSVSASAGTHSGAGAVDLAPADWANKVRVMREVGFAAWHRPAMTGVWPEHIHALLIPATAEYRSRMAPAAQAQIDDYYQGLNGLADHAPDPFPRPSPIPVFYWSPDRLTRGTHVDGALVHLSRVTAPSGSLRETQVNKARSALRQITAKQTNTPWIDIAHGELTTGSRGPEVDRALAHIRRALLVAFGTRRTLLVAARDALRVIPVLP